MSNLNTNNFNAKIIEIKSQIEKNPQDPNLWYQLSLELYKNNLIDESIDNLRILIEQFPRFSAGFNLCGIIFQQSGKWEDSINFFNQAIEIDNQVSDYYNNLAISYININQFDKAESVFLSAYNVNKNNFDICHNLALLYQKMGDAKKTKIFFEKALKIEKDNIGVYENYSFYLNSIEEFDNSITLISYAESQAGKSYQLLINKAYALEKITKIDDALDSYLEALSYVEDNPELHFNIGGIYEQKRDWNNAQRFYEKAIELKSDFLKAIFNLAGIYHRLNKFNYAVECYDKLIGSEFNQADVYSNYAVTLTEMMDFESAKKTYLKALELAPTDYLIHLNYSVLLLLINDYETGWKEYQSRLSIGGEKNYIKREWKGEDVSGKTILIKEEQGVGDLIQFIRYLKWFKDQKATVILECRKSLHKLIENFPYFDQLIESGRFENIEFDYEFFIMSIPYLFNINPAEPLGLEKYISPTSDKVNFFSQIIRNTSKLKVGICWKGNIEHFYDYKRSIPFNDFKNLLDVKKVVFYPIQLSEEIEEINSDLPENINTEISEYISDFNDTAAIIKNLDLIITVDTSVAHIAGAMGIPCWVLLSKVPDWRWGLQGSTTNWYKSVKLYRQKSQGDWISLIKVLKNDLENYSKTKSEKEFLDEAEVFVRENQINNAISILIEGIKVYPESYDLLLKLGYLSHLKNDQETAIGYYYSALKIRPNDLILFNNIGMALIELKRFEQSRKVFELSLYEFPESEMLLNNYSILLFIQGEFDKCSDVLHKTLQKNQNSTETLINLGILHDSMGYSEKAIEYFDKVLELDPHNVKARFNRSLMLLKIGDFENGWKEYEWRRKMNGFPKRTFNKPELEKIEQIKGNKIYIFDEQGFGDTFNFVRFLKLLKENDAYIIFECHKNVYELLKELPYIDKIVPRENYKEPAIDYDYFIPLLSIPKLLKVDLRVISEVQTDLHIKNWKIKDFENIKELKIGLFWRGRQPVNNLQRACPLTNFETLLQNKSYKFYSLQIEGFDPGDKEIMHKYNVESFENRIKSFLDTAKIILNMDLVITIDTSIAHLAGILGKPAYLLLSFNADWRWFRDYSYSPWYPEMKVLRQTEFGNWTEIIKNIEENIKNLKHRN